MSKRTLIVVVMVIVLIGGGFFVAGGGSFAAKPTPTPAADIADLESLVTASGTLVPVNRANLAFKVGGPVTAVHVRAGDQVKQGDVLVETDHAQLQAAVQVAQANLDQLKAGATEQEIAVAEANLDAARSQLAKVQAPATVEQVQIAKAGLDSAAAALSDAQSEYDKVKDDPEVGSYPQSATLHQAALDYSVAQAHWMQVVKGASAEDIRVAQTAVAVAQAEMDRVRAGPRPEQIAAAQAQLDEAKAALADTAVRAPFDGLVASVAVRQGETAAPGVPVVTIGDNSKLRLETDDLAESSIARVKLGQQVSVTFEALAGRIFQGKVTFIAPISSEKQGGTNYATYVEIADLDPTLRWGMTGHVEIDTRQ